MYAAGDVLGRPFLASTGMAQGVAAIRSMFREDLAAREEAPVGEGGADDREATPVVRDDSSDDSASSCKGGELCMTGENFDPKSRASNPFVEIQVSGIDLPFPGGLFGAL